MTILSKSNYHVRLNVKMDIADSISFNFNFGNGYYFALSGLKQHFFDEARFFLVNRVNPVIILTEERKRWKLALTVRYHLKAF